MVAPFWADVDIGRYRNEYLGHVWKKVISDHKFAVAWDHVGYYHRQSNLENTFMVMISDGTDPSMGIGINGKYNNVCFCYESMEWTTGDFTSENNDGFGGIAATAGANKGDGEYFFPFGRFNGK